MSLNQTNLSSHQTLNVLGEPLEMCSCKPKTGYLRDGFCNTTPDDFGTHVVCAIITLEFLEFSRSRGNDLITPRPEWNFPGLKPGDKWCLCVSRWKEAVTAKVGPKVDLSATNIVALRHVSLDLLKEYAFV